MTEAPADADCVGGVAAMVKSGAAVTTATAVPVSAELCVPTLSTTVSDAVSLPAAVGEKVIVMVHDPPAASEVPHVLAPIVKAEALAPVTPIDVMGSAAVPAFASVKVCDVLVEPTLIEPKSAVAGVSAAFGADTTAATPVPLSTEVCVPTESVTDRLAEKLPAAAGENMTVMVQEPPAASDVPHVPPVTAKLPAFIPVSPIEVMGSAAVPALDSLKVCAALVLPAVTLPKSAVAGVSAACGADVVATTPVPDNDAVTLVEA